MFANLPDDSKDINSINARLCPDMDLVKDTLRLKNSYTNKEERVSFSIQTVLCNDEYSDIYEKDPICESQGNI